LKLISIFALALVLASCATKQNTSPVETDVRTPSAVTDLTGTYLAEGLYSKRTHGLRNPAMRIYFDRAAGESNSYYGVLVEYDQLLNMALPFLASEKAPALNHVVGYLDKIATRISAYKFVPSNRAGTYEMRNLEVKKGQIVPADSATMFLILNPKADSRNPLAGAVISGNKDGNILFPSDDNDSGFISRIGEALNLTQLKLATIVYKKGHLASTWRGNWKDLEGSYLSEYGRFTDGVHELYSANGQTRAKFIKTNTTKAKYFTNPKSGSLEGDFAVSEPVPKFYVLTPTKKAAATASDVEMNGRIGVFLDVFDASAPEAGGHMVTELAYINSQDPEDFMMYYEHPQHLKNVGVEPKK
jgi:hypothetical protein